MIFDKYICGVAGVVKRGSLRSCRLSAYIGSNPILRIIFDLNIVFRINVQNQKLLKHFVFPIILF